MKATTPCRDITLKYWQSNKERVRRLNASASDCIRSKLSRIPLAEEQLCVSAIGSDGRLEKGMDSKLEVQIIHRDLNPEAVGEVDMMLREICVSGHPLLNDTETEVKRLGSDSMVYAFSNPLIAAPARIFDSVVLFGHPALQRQAKGMLVRELAGPGGKRAHNRIKDRKNSFKRIMERGTQLWKGIDVTHFDLERGISYFSDQGDGNGGIVQVRGFKHGPLRYVQSVIEQNISTLVRALMRRNDNLGALMILDEMPTPTIEKLEYMNDTGIIGISRDGVSEASECYLRFLQLYHLSEWMAGKGKDEMEFDPQEARSRIEALTRLLEGGIIKGI